MVQLTHSTATLGTWDAQEVPEDTHAYERYFFGRAGGTFLESGAVDGIRFSVTHSLEMDLGWRGVSAGPVWSNHAGLCGEGVPRTPHTPSVLCVCMIGRAVFTDRC